MVLVIHFASTAALTGLIWVVQLVVYPMLLATGEESFPKLHRLEMRQIGYVVIPLMLTELATGCWLFVDAGLFMRRSWQLVGLALIAMAWITTFAWAVPVHRRLVRDGYDLALVRQLQYSNLPRLICWTLRIILLLVAAFPMAHAG